MEFILKKNEGFCKPLHQHIHLLKGVNVLIGKNGSGKSRLLQFLFEKAKEEGLRAGHLQCLFELVPASQEARALTESLGFLSPESQGLSSGEKRFLSLLAFCQKNKGTQILLIDDVETGLHLSIQEKIMEAIISICPNAMIIVTTHSPDIVGMNLDQVINLM